jgi:hypothetical protein
VKFHTATRKEMWRACRKRDRAFAREIGICIWCWKYPVEVREGVPRLGCVVCYAQRAIAQAHRRAEGRA